MAEKKKSTPPKDWWGIGILLFTLGLGSLFHGLVMDEPEAWTFFGGALATGVGLFLIIGSAVAHGVRAEGKS